MKKILSKIILSVGLLSVVACQSSNRVSHGMNTAFRGIGHLILSPIQISAGLLEGISAVPYFIATGIHDINKGMISAQQKITLHDTYDSAYGKDLSQVPDDGDTGTMFYRMKQATAFFQKVLKEYGVDNPEQYILTSVDTANRAGYTLFAVVQRAPSSIEIKNKYKGSGLKSYNSSDRMFYDAFKMDSRGRSLDRVIDWAGIPRKYIKTQKAQAVLITLAANSVVEGKTRNDYWDIEKLWMSGEYLEVCKDKSLEVRRKMNIPDTL
jgi:hypothetical protein